MRRQPLLRASPRPASRAISKVVLRFATFSGSSRNSSKPTRNCGVNLSSSRRREKRLTTTIRWSKTRVLRSPPGQDDVEKLRKAVAAMRALFGESDSRVQKLASELATAQSQRKAALPIPTHIRNAEAVVRKRTKQKESAAALVTRCSEAAAAAAKQLQEAQAGLTDKEKELDAAQESLDDLRWQQLPSVAPEGTKRAADGQTTSLASAFEHVRKFFASDAAALATYDLLAKDHGPVNQVLALPDGCPAGGSDGAGGNDGPPNKKGCRSGMSWAY